MADGVEGIHGLELSNAMHLSSWLEKPVSLPIDEDLFLEKLNEHRANVIAGGFSINTFMPRSSAYCVIGT